MRKTLLTFLLLVAVLCYADGRKEIILNDGWQFSRDSVNWTPVSVPHDWAIDGPFDKKWDLQYVAIEQNGEKEKTEKSGRSGALPWIGRGYYCTTVTLDEQPASALLVFDGAMSEPQVRINGQYAGGWAYGYNAFRIDAARFLNKGDNIIEVSLNNMEESSRWYPGGGIYRPVTLILGESLMLDDWATYFHTLSIDDNSALVEVACGVRGDMADDLVAVEVVLYNDKGRQVAAYHSTVDEEGKCKSQMTIHAPQLWSPESPYLYTMETRLYRNYDLVDTKTIRVGIRTIEVSAEHGFQLNGQTRKIKGVCLHHD